jgi:phosphatidylethanolamine/phosphatidyl-N-methylethanolamine N-methyltransferase
MTSVATSSHTQAALPHRPRPSAGRGVFLREFFRSPRVLGTCFTSSRALAAKMVDGLDLARAKAVIEYGPGTGAVTGAILEHIPDGCRFLAVERNPSLARVFRARFPGVTLFEEDAAGVRALCARAGVRTGAVDCIVSGLPWLAFAPGVQRTILRETVAALRPGGGFTTVTYSAGHLHPRARPFRRLLQFVFSEVTVSKPVWLNLPPASVYLCRK